MSCGRPHATPCTEVVASLSAYIDGELGAQEFHVIAVHITECPPCGREEQVQRTVKALVMRAASVSGAPGSLHDRVRARVISDATSGDASSGDIDLEH